MADTDEPDDTEEPEDTDQPARDDVDLDDLDYDGWIDDSGVLESKLCPDCHEVTHCGEPWDIVECPNCGAVVRLDD